MAVRGTSGAKRLSTGVGDLHGALREGINRFKRQCSVRADRRRQQCSSTEEEWEHAEAELVERPEGAPRPCANCADAKTPVPLVQEPGVFHRFCPQVSKRRREWRLSDSSGIVGPLQTLRNYKLLPLYLRPVQSWTIPMACLLGCCDSSGPVEPPPLAATPWPIHRRQEQV